MAKRLVQFVLILSFAFGAAAQALACIPMAQAGDHSCCRIAMAKRAAQRMRAVPTSSGEANHASPCCANHTPRPQQSPAERRDAKQDDAIIFANGAGFLSTPARPEAPPAKSFAPSASSPPHFILCHSLLI